MPANFRAIWLPGAFDAFVHEYVHRTRVNVYEALFRRLANVRTQLLLDVTRNGLCDMLHLSIALCGAKGSISILGDVYERVDNFAAAQSTLELSLPMTERTKRTREEFLDNFVRLSKSVPKCSYFCSSLKWSAQRSFIYAGDLWNGDRLILKDVNYYMTAIRNKGRRV